MKACETAESNKNPTIKAEDKGKYVVEKHMQQFISVPPYQSKITA